MRTYSSSESFLNLDEDMALTGIGLKGSVIMRVDEELISYQSDIKAMRVEERLTDGPSLGEAPPALGLQKAY